MSNRKSDYKAVLRHFGTSPPYVKARLGWSGGLPEDIHEYTANKVIEMVMEALYEEQTKHSPDYAESWISAECDCSIHNNAVCFICKKPTSSSRFWYMVKHPKQMVCPVCFARTPAPRLAVLAELMA